MTRLRIFRDDDAGVPIQESSVTQDIQAWLKDVGVHFEVWHANAPIQAGDAPEVVMAAYGADIKRLMGDRGYQSADVISLSSDHPDRVSLRQKFLSEHTHAEDEVRFFVDGQGLFSLHIGAHVYEVLCQKGDLIGVPANTPHWFDMGPHPRFVAIRLFTNPEGWIAHYTGSAIADTFPRLEN